MYWAPKVSKGITISPKMINEIEIREGWAEVNRCRNPPGEMGAHRKPLFIIYLKTNQPSRELASSNDSPRQTRIQVLEDIFFRRKGHSVSYQRTMK